ncbi:hypothetical protein Ddc_09679 [Ditylenchus destructor]|nr:hypothetical protein Ddc_09679 [Ditylenchus destructor]
MPGELVCKRSPSSFGKSIYVFFLRKSQPLATAFGGRLLVTATYDSSLWPTGPLKGLGRAMDKFNNLPEEVS